MISSPSVLELMTVPQMHSQALFHEISDLLHLAMTMAIMEVVAPASGCLIELAHDLIHRHRVHVPAGIESDLLFDGLD